MKVPTFYISDFEIHNALKQPKNTDLVFDAHTYYKYMFLIVAIYINLPNALCVRTGAHFGANKKTNNPQKKRRAKVNSCDENASKRLIETAWVYVQNS